MLTMKVTGLAQAIDVSESWATHVVSLIDPDYEGPLPIAEHHCQQRFHDLTPQQSADPFWSLSGLQPILANAEHLQCILAFTQHLSPQEQLLIHCHAGISRSTAVACGVLCQHGHTPQQAWEHVLSLQPIAMPNPYILHLLDKILALRGELVRLSKTH